MERPLGASLEARTSVSPDTPPGPASPDDRPAAGPSKPPSGPDPRPSTAPSGPEPRPLPGPPGRRARDIRLLWTANAADALGTQASGVVLPLLLLGLGHSPAVVGLIAGVSTAAGLVTGPLAAVPADRGARKKVMFWSAVVSSLAMASVALAVADGSPALPTSWARSWWSVSPPPATRRPPGEPSP